MRFAAVANHFGRRWRHAILAMDGDTACAERLDPGLDVSFPQVSLPKGATLANARRCRALLRSWAPATLVTTNWGAIEWALGNLPPLVRHVHVEEGLGPDEVGGQFARRVWLRRLALRWSTLVVPSHGLERMAAEVWRLPPARTLRILNGVDLARFAPRREPREGPVVIGTVAMLRPEKAIGRLLRAFAILRRTVPARLVVVGDGPERGALESLAGELALGEDVRFLGRLARPEDAYAGFDIVALSSDSEQMPLCVLEAMACGLPVAATAVGDVPEMLSEPNRRFIVPRDDAALAGALQDLAAAPGLRAAIGAANRERAAAAYGQDAMLAAWGRVFDGA
jgi:glycosyltransferase involved in cell wall biosynthesis